jgi:hypothetical protein
MRPARSYYVIDSRDHPKARSGCSDRETPDRFSFENFRSLGLSRFRFLGLVPAKRARWVLGAVDRSTGANPNDAKSANPYTRTSS